ncbi:hypothetical protein [Nonomuraea rhizosphaerae]|uniref:hypothetical protein n=1 Tax=Nonomuraea rhizosphaerae TaxID=2665663 RepID=UPI001C605E45|nr:hypothetical protein [Nonomuraea rhizosphaerae]
MSKLKTTMAAAALSTALTGGVVGLGAAAASTTANAATTASAADSVTAAPVLAHRWCRWNKHHKWGHRKHGWGGHRWGHHRWGSHRWGHHRYGRHHGRYINRVKIRLNLAKDKVRFTHRRGCLSIHHGTDW